jgi:hypothetical protein
MAKGYDRAMRPWGNAVALAVVGAFAVGACSSGGDDASQTSTTVVTATTEATTTASTTQAPTTLPPATEAPTTTIDLAEAFAADVEAALLETFRLTDEAFQDPTNDAKVEAALAGYTGANLDLIRSQLEDYEENNQEARPNPDVPAGTTIEAPARREGDLAILQVCEISPWVVVELGAGPNGSDAIVNADVYAYRSNYVMEQIDGRWLIAGGELIGEWVGGESCPES